MKVLVSTKQTQGQRKNDFSWVPEDEPLTFAQECDGEAVDGRCGCRRSFSGLICHTATTTAKIVDLPISRDELLAQVEAHNGSYRSLFSEAEFAQMNSEEVDELLGVAAAFLVGDVIEKRGVKLQTRRH